jgi:hypothetical protein
MHHILVADVAVGEDHAIDPKAADELRELLLGVDGDALGIQGAG